MTRIVRMHFREDAVAQFLSDVFEPSKALIRAFPGCQGMTLLRDLAHPSILVTLSHWDGPEALEAYRASTLFRNTWARTKPLFAAPPQAMSLETVDAPPGRN